MFLTIRAKVLSCCLKSTCLYFAVLLIKGDSSSFTQKEHKHQVLWPQKKQFSHKNLFYKDGKSCPAQTNAGTQPMLYVQHLSQKARLFTADIPIPKRLTQHITVHPTQQVNDKALATKDPSKLMDSATSGQVFPSVTELKLYFLQSDTPHPHAPLWLQLLHRLHYSPHVISTPLHPS